MGASTTEYVNTNGHRVYVQDPERAHDDTATTGLLRIIPGETVKTSNAALRERLDETTGVEPVSSKVGKDFLKRGGVADQRAALVAGPGPAAFPVPEDERVAERSGLHITGRDSGVPVASPDEPGDTKDGTGEDHFKGIAAVENGEVTRGDLPKALEDEPTTETPGDLTELSVKELRKLAKQRNVNLSGAKKKAQIVARLEAPAAEGGGGGVATQTEDASKSEKSDSEGAAPNTGTLTSDKVPSRSRKSRSRKK